MPDRPLLILPSPGEPVPRPRRYGGGGTPHLPSRERQGERLGPRFSALQDAFDARRTRLRADVEGTMPEQVIVLETVGPIDEFLRAVRRVEGLEWLTEVEEEDLPPDDDFFVADKTTGEPTEKPLRGRVFLVFSNQRALQEILSLWSRWKVGERLRRGFAKWGHLFGQLRDVRTWGAEDRLAETGVLDDWRERVRHGQETVPCEIELWYREDAQARESAAERVSGLVEGLNGQVVGQASVGEIAYHALLARLPVERIGSLLGGADADLDLVQCEAIQYVRASGQMAGIVSGDERSLDDAEVPEAETEIGPPIVALLDGLPLQNHRRLEGRLVIDDPDGFEENYPARDRRHGTAMSSLIIHGDLGAGEPPLSRKVYVRPILRPDPRDWESPRRETAPEDVLVVDLIHRSVRRIVEGDGAEPPAAPQVCVVNLSIGIRDRCFQSALSPLARLLDWLAWRYHLLFLVSAGNHGHPIDVSVPQAQLEDVAPSELQEHVVRAVAEDARHRRLLSPAEAMNVLTVAATHADAASNVGVVGAVAPYVDDQLPSLINAQGMGYRRSIKPDVLTNGGRVVLMPSAQQPSPESMTRLDVYEGGRAPGQAVAAPGPSAGDLSYSRYERGTSNATALASRAASQIYDVLEELSTQPEGEILEQIPRSLWLKVLLGHSARWDGAGETLTEILRTPANRRKFREYLTRLLGYGAVDPSASSECTASRVTALGGGTLQAGQSHIHRVPLPPSLSGRSGMRRLTVTLAWFTPVNPRHQSWRRAQLWFAPPKEELRVERRNADWRAVQRGTLQHEILEGTRATAFVDGDEIEIQVSCREEAGSLEESVPYALAVTLEVAEALGIDIYSEVRARVPAARVGVVPRT